jgi:hypothetical protein
MQDIHAFNRKVAEPPPGRSFQLALTVPLCLRPR